MLMNWSPLLAKVVQLWNKWAQDTQSTTWQTSGEYNGVKRISPQALIYSTNKGVLEMHGAAARTVILSAARHSPGFMENVL
jgi:hypothetical protein